MNFTNILTLLSALSTSVIGADMGDGLAMTAPAVGTADAPSDGGHGHVHEVCPVEYEAIDSCLRGLRVDDALMQGLETALEECIEDPALGAPLPELLSMGNNVVCHAVCGRVDTCIGTAMSTMAAMGINANSCCPLYYAGVNCFMPKASDQLAGCECQPPTALPTSFGLVASILKKNLRA
mmetsp:Transcript_9781/g.20676  ORF Transcript_9781/g.20676 Transcript_9781/m.20676 type:complete len:180 (-) Transcript_9781:209-748(-)